MGLTSAFQIGRSALTASQLGIQVAGNNLANASSPDYTRQTALLSPSGGRLISQNAYSGGGVAIDGVRREINEALQQRLRTGIADESAARTRLDVYSGVESSLNELTGYDLSSQLSTFFNSWSERANLVQSSAVIVQQGEELASFMRTMRSDLVDQRQQIDGELGAAVERADSLLSEIADVNGQIANAETGGATAPGLRDKRDELLSELSGLMDVSTIEHANGAVDVLVGSTPVVLGGLSRGLDLVRESDNGDLSVRIVLKDDRTTVPITSGRVGALLDARGEAVDGTIEKLDAIASELIFRINQIHANGTNLDGLTSASGTMRISPADQTLALNDPTNSTLAQSPFTPTNGGFLVHVNDEVNGGTRTVRIDVDLDGIDATGTSGFGDDTSAEDIRAALDAIPGLNATFDAGGRLNVEAATGFSFSFAEDSSGVLAALGVNSYFTGTDASDIAVRDDLIDDPNSLMVGRIDDGTFVENATALAIAGVQDESLDGLGGENLRASWSNAVQQVANRTSAAVTRADAAGVVRDSLEAQRAAQSGVSIDEETMNLLSFQRQFQGAARIISIADQLLQTLFAIV